LILNSMVYLFIFLTGFTGFNIYRVYPVEDPAGFGGIIPSNSYSLQDIQCSFDHDPGKSLLFHVGIYLQNADFRFQF
jgi:hypothetical protein